MIVEDYGICSRKVDTQPSSTGTQQEDENVGSNRRSSTRVILCSELLYFSPGLPFHDHVSSILQLRRTIQPQILVLTINQILLHQVHHPCHLEINKNTMISRFEFL